MANSTKRMAEAIKKDLVRYLVGIQASVDEDVAFHIGHAVVGAMLDAISKGQSPIEGVGRFPAYLAAGRQNELRKVLRGINAGGRRRRMNARQLKAQAKFIKRTKLFRSKNNIRAANASVKSQRASLKTLKALEAHDKASVRGKISDARRGYPYSVRGKFPDKRPRPVNLLLSGEFLAALEHRVVGIAGQYSVEIGFFEDSDKDRKTGVHPAIKEQGHREGANGQPERPIIPIGREDFQISIQKAIIKIVDEVIDRAAVLGSR